MTQYKSGAQVTSIGTSMAVRILVRDRKGEGPLEANYRINALKESALFEGLQDF